MFICRLFHREQPFEQVDARIIAEGETTIGRAGDWPLSDTEGGLSRVHCTLAVENGRLFLRDKSTNGTFLDDGRRAPLDTPIELFPRQTIHLGSLSILVDLPEAETVDGDATTLRSPLSIAYTPTPSDWSDPLPEPSTHRDASLMEAFCEGAGLDACDLSSEDAAELMKRVGRIYRQTVLGLATLMTERARLKGEYELGRTTIGASANNPFKWTPTRKLAQDLLCGAEAGFLSDAEAVRASFDDLGRHMAALAEGASAAAKIAIDALDPGAIDEEARGQGSLLQSRQALRWEAYRRRHAHLAGDGEGGEAMKRAFGEAYSRALEGSA